MTTVNYPLSGNARAIKTANFLNISTVTLWRWTKAKPDFPQPARLSPGVTVFDAQEIRQWIELQKNK